MSTFIKILMTKLYIWEKNCCKNCNCNHVLLTFIWILFMAILWWKVLKTKIKGPTKGNSAVTYDHAYNKKFVHVNNICISCKIEGNKRILWILISLIFRFDVKAVWSKAGVCWLIHFILLCKLYGYIFRCRWPLLITFVFCRSRDRCKGLEDKVRRYPNKVSMVSVKFIQLTVIF